MQRRVWLLVLVLAQVLACACRARPAATTSRATPNEPAVSAPQAKAPAPPPKVPSQPPPNIALRGEVADDRVTLVLEQRDAKQLRLKTAIAVERSQSEHFAPLTGGALALRDSCEHEPAECIELVPGAELRPPAWPKGSAQCAGKGTALGPGRYRFVAHACDGSYRVAGEPFVVE